MDSQNFLNLNKDENYKDDMSPVANLAKNLSSLSTDLPLTPCRRITWSSPHPNKPKSYLHVSQDSPISFDSPSFQEGVLRGIELNKQSWKKEKFRPAHNIITSKHKTRDKENFDGSFTMECMNSSPTPALLSSGHISESDFSGGSQESGYYDANFSTRQSSVPSVRSSIFTDEEIDEDEAFFPIDKLSDKDDVSTSMSELLTNPLRDSIDSFKSSLNISEPLRKTKPAIRRCLSMFSPGIKYSISKECLHSNNGETIEVEISAEPHVSAKAFKRPEPVHESTPFQTKRRRSSPNVKVPSASKQILHRCYSETAATIMKAVQKSDQNPDFIGDFSKPFLLPLIHGRHQDLKTIKSETLLQLLRGEFDDVNGFSVIDCRYPYEYEGGHIRGAKNIFTREDIKSTFLSGKILQDGNDCNQRELMIFHCEFSSERAPKLLRFLRSKDREINESFYPRLFHPEIYLLEGGYKAFYQNFKEFCEPQNYVPMVHEDHARELCEFRAKAKSFGNESKVRSKSLRSNLKF